MYFLLMFFMAIILLWFRSNYPTFENIADLYLWFIAFGFIFWTFDAVTSIAANKNQINPPPYTQIINTAFYEKNTIVGPIPLSMRIGSYIFIFFSCVFLALFIGTSKTMMVDMHTFQIIDLGVTGELIIATIMSFSEDIIFFGVIAPSVAGIGRLLSLGNQIIGAGLSLAVTPIAFTIFHILVYGATNVPASIFVFMFALVCTSWTLIMRNIIFCNFLHATNNLTLRVAGAIGVAVGG